MSCKPAKRVVLKGRGGLGAEPPVDTGAPAPQKKDLQLAASLFFVVLGRPHFEKWLEMVGGVSC